MNADKHELQFTTDAEDIELKRDHACRWEICGGFVIDGLLMEF